MARELAYTSARQGIMPGSHGFCTVAMSQGLPTPMRMALEALTGYRAPPWNPPLAQSPVEYLHTAIASSGQRFHVLGAVRAAPPDHSGRSNKFAHFVILEAGELDPNGPAALIRTDDVVRTEWSGAPELLPSHRALPPAIHRGPAICRAWHALAGDAGWAGALVGDFILDASKPTHVIVPKDADPLQLVDEALALLPPEWRWRVTFSTYWQRALPNHVCAWRFLFDGTPEATAVRQQGVRVMDLCANARCPREGRYVEAARSGLLAIPDVADSFADGEAKRQHQAVSRAADTGARDAGTVGVAQQLAGREPVDERAAEVPAGPAAARPGGGGKVYEREVAQAAHGPRVLLGVLGLVVGLAIASAVMWVLFGGEVSELKTSLTAERARGEAGEARAHEAEVKLASANAAREIAVEQLETLRSEAQAETVAAAALATTDGELETLRTRVEELKEQLAARGPAPATAPAETSVTEGGEPAAPSDGGDGTSGSAGDRTATAETAPPAVPAAPATTVVSVSSKTNDSSPLHIASGKVEVRVLDDLLEATAPDGGSIGIDGAALTLIPAAGPSVTIAKATQDSSGGGWSWTRLSSAGDVNLAPWGGYEGLLRGVWLESTEPPTQRVALSVGSGGTPTITCYPGGRPQAVTLPAWCRSVQVIDLESGATEGPDDSGKDATWLLGSDAARLPIQLARESDGSEMVVLGWTGEEMQRRLEASVEAKLPPGVASVALYADLLKKLAPAATGAAQLAKAWDVVPRSGPAHDQWVELNKPRFDALARFSQEMGKPKAGIGGKANEGKSIEECIAVVHRAWSEAGGEPPQFEGWLSVLKSGGRGSQGEETFVRDSSSLLAALVGRCEAVLSEAQSYQWPARRFALIAEGYEPAAGWVPGMVGAPTEPPGALVIVECPAAAAPEVKGK